MRLLLGEPNEKQRTAMLAKCKYVAYGGARGGGKSWFVRTKAILLAYRYCGIRQLIVRRTYPELMRNHIEVLRGQLLGFAKYNDKDKVLKFPNGSTIHFAYCDKENDTDRLQGTEYDVIYLDEATQLSELQMQKITACVRGVNAFPKRVYFTCNPGGQGHAYIKRLFIDRRYKPGEKPEDYAFIKALPTDNAALTRYQPDYIKQLEALPPKLRRAWLDGDWDIFEGQFFEEFTDDPKHYKDGRWTHVIDPFDVGQTNMRIYRSYDWGYNKPFSCAWWAVSPDDVVYRILELYGCTDTPNEGVKWTTERQFAEIARMEREHPYLRGKHIRGVADPSIWDASRGESIADAAKRQGVFFEPGDNARIPGWMQCHYRLAFDENGYPMMYVFSTCKAFIRTIPLLCYSPSPTHPEDLDTSMEDHVADEWRYFLMTRPIGPRVSAGERGLQIAVDPLNQMVRGHENAYFER